MVHAPSLSHKLGCLVMERYFDGSDGGYGFIRFVAF